MLIGANSTNYQQNDVVTFKLITGEELVARVQETLTDGWTVKNAMTVMAGGQGLGLVPSLFTVPPDGIMTLSKNHVVLHSKSEKNFADKYMENTSSIKIARP